MKCLGEVSDEENEAEESVSSAVDGERDNNTMKGLDFVLVLMSLFFTKKLNLKFWKSEQYFYFWGRGVGG